MILTIGCVKEVTCIPGSVKRKVQVISAGPPDEPSSAWAVTIDEPKRFVLVKQVAPAKDGVLPQYMGMIR